VLVVVAAVAPAPDPYPYPYLSVPPTPLITTTTTATPTTNQTLAPIKNLGVPTRFYRTKGALCFSNHFKAFPTTVFLVMCKIHPLVRALYKQALYVGIDYPLGIDKIRDIWKEAIRNPKNCPSCYDIIIRRDDRKVGYGDCYSSDREEYYIDPTNNDDINVDITIVATPQKICSKKCEKELRSAVGKGRLMIREMTGVIQLKKYRSMKRRYDGDDNK